MTTSTPPGISRATLRNPADLIASLPYLLGFRPADSLVLLGHRVPGTTIGLMLRADLPARELQAEQADALIPRFANREHNGVTVVLVGGSADENGPPHREFLAELQRVLARHSLRLFHALWASEIEPGAEWACYLDPDCGGVVPDPQETVIAAATTEAGFVVFRSREELAAVLQPRCPEAITRRAELLASSPEPLYSPGMSRSDVLDAAVTELRDAFLRQRRGAGPPDDDQAVRLAHALMFTPIRDACMALAVPPHTSLTREAEEVWLTLVRELPPPHRAEAALYLGYTALMRGEGALAGMALANAVEADPDHMVAQLLQTAWNIGTDPAKLAGLADLSTAVDLGLSPPSEPGSGAERDRGRRSGPPRGMR
ncbi:MULTISPECIES: DUF4192 domain-containing protein [Amycolatopsis]|uniref:DUF4192 domain-containing protein n=1 Tax=Amycolatopsis albidoflavus TaxID=102226 RepID=A0ABW5HP36_9PSEU